MIDLNQYKGAFPWVDEIIKELEESRSELLKKTKAHSDLGVLFIEERERNEKLVEALKNIAKSGTLNGDKAKKALAENEKEKI